jgi:nicotinate-nucleotide pyrophosphorylase (carboxylating)
MSTKTKGASGMAEVDMRALLLQACASLRCAFAVTAESRGVLAGMDRAGRSARDLGLEVSFQEDDRSELRPGQCVMRGSGPPILIAKAEETLLGYLGKAAGIASAAARAKAIAHGRGEVVCGAWKKLFPEVKDQVRSAVEAGGIRTRLVPGPMIYLDKNYVRMFGSVKEAVGTAAEVRSAAPHEGADARLIVVQLREEYGPIESEAAEAIGAGADVLMVDNGSLGTLRRVSEVLEAAGGSHGVKLAFGGGVSIESLPDALAAGADIVDVGRAIIDAPLIGFSLDVVGS